MGSRADATATEKRIFCKVRRKLGEWVGRWSADSGDAPVRRNDTWFAENQRWSIRDIAANLCGLSSATLGKCWEGMQDNQGVLTAANVHGPAKKTLKTSQ